jgi:hypothetical protein
MWAAGMAVGTVGAALLVAPSAAYAVVSVGPQLVLPGNQASVSDPDATFNTSTSVVQLYVASCPAKFTAASPAASWDATVGTRTATKIDFTVPVGPTAGTNGVAKLYNVCVYDNTVVGTSSLQTTGANIYVGPQPMLTPQSGVSGGGNQVTVAYSLNAPVFTGVANVGAVFASGACPATYGSPNASNVAGNITKISNMSVSLNVPPGVTVANGAGPANYNLCFYDGSSAGSTLLSFSNYTAHLVGLNVNSGSYLASVGLTASSPNPILSGVTTPAVLLMQNQGCPGTYSTAPFNGTTPVAVTAAGSVRKLSSYRLAVTVPPLPLANPGQPTPYQICFYAGSAGGALLATSGYTAAVVANPTGLSPAAGPATGGSVITVSGTDFPTEPDRITATLGGVPLENIKPISDKAFTAETPAHAVENNVTLVVSTSAGTKALQGAYSFLNPVKVSPNTAPNTAPTVDVDVRGMGFLSVNFGAGGNTGRVFLVNGVYNGADAGGGVRANGPVAECGNVLLIDDNELICTLQLNRRLNPTGTGFFDPVTYSNILTADVLTTAGSRVISSNGKKFNANDIGQPIVEASSANIPANSIITSVLSPAKAVISAPAKLTTATAITANVGNLAVRTFANSLVTKAQSPTVSLISGAFTGADVGRVFNGTAGIPNGTTIVAVAPGGAGAALSVAATADAPAGVASASLYAAAPVPVGMYNLAVVSNGAPDAADTDPSYWQSAVTSGSAFTVAPF